MNLSQLVSEKALVFQDGIMLCLIVLNTVIRQKKYYNGQRPIHHLALLIVRVNFFQVYVIF